MQAHGISTMTVAEKLILVGDNPERIHSEAVLAKLCGVCPIPASSGKTNRMRLNRGGNRHANAALYRVAIVRTRDNERTKTYAARRTAEGRRQNPTRNRALHQAVHRPRNIPRLVRSTGPNSRYLTNIGASTRPFYGGKTVHWTVF